MASCPLPRENRGGQNLPQVRCPLHLGACHLRLYLVAGQGCAAFCRVLKLQKGHQAEDPSRALLVYTPASTPASPSAGQINYEGVWQGGRPIDTKGLVFATDASGGSHSPDPRLRRVGVSVVALKKEAQGLTKTGQITAQVPGRQTVFRGELWSWI